MAFSKNYLQLEFGSGLFFVYSQEEKEGYDKHVSSKNNVSYRKYFKKGITGTLDSVTIYDGKFGRQISISIVDGDQQYYIPIDIFNQKGNISEYAESLIKLLPNLDKGMEITVFAYNFKPEGSNYSKIGVAITHKGEKIKHALTNSYVDREGKLHEGDIPAIIWVNKMGTNKPSAASLEAKDMYLYGILEREENRLTWKKTEGRDNNRQPSQSESKKMDVATPQQAFDIPSNASEDNDDLPF